MGVFSMISSDAQAMGRVGEVVLRTWQTADKMKKQRGMYARRQSSFLIIIVQSVMLQNIRLILPSHMGFLNMSVRLK